MFLLQLIIEIEHSYSKPIKIHQGFFEENAMEPLYWGARRA
jgi:hypothetical protein